MNYCGDFDGDMQRDLERKVIFAAAMWRKDVRNCPSVDFIRDDLIKAVDNYLANQKHDECFASQKKVAEIEPLNWQGKCFMVSPLTQDLFNNMIDVVRKVDELVAAVNKLLAQSNVKP